MKVAINSSPLKSGHANRGIGVYTQNLLLALKKHPEIELLEFARLDEVKQADVVHYPFFDLFQHTLPLNKKFPTIVTIHDVTPLVFPKAYPPGIKGGINLSLQKFALQNVKAIITDSQASKNDIQIHLGINPDKIVPIYLAASSEFRIINDKKSLENTKKKFNLPEKFAVYNGNVNWNKNINNLTKACLNANLDLVIIGKSFLEKDNLNHAEKRAFKQFLANFENNPRVHRLGFVETRDLANILNMASCLLMPSFYEGFGLPILEAQACGTPVIISRISSMPEVAGDAAMYVEPQEEAQIMMAIAQLLQDEKLYKDLVQKGLENVKKFSWQKCADQTINVYSQVAK